MPGRLKDARLRLHVACEPGWRDAVVAAAAAEGESLSAYVRTAVDARLSGRRHNLLRSPAKSTWRTFALRTEESVGGHDRLSGGRTLSSLAGKRR